jgi:hypothetical protein
MVSVFSTDETLFTPCSVRQRKRKNNLEKKYFYGKRGFFSFKATLYSMQPFQGSRWRPSWMSGRADHQKEPSSSHPQSDQSTQAFVL